MAKIRNFEFESQLLVIPYFIIKGR